jgi:hypothetical protein
MLEAESIRGHSAAGRIKSIEKLNDLIGNRTRDFPACSIVPKPTTLPRALYRPRPSVNFKYIQQQNNAIISGIYSHAFSHIR